MDKSPVCGFCKKGEEVKETCGPLYWQRFPEPAIAAHHKCMQYSAKLGQYKFSNFGGFDTKEVQDELKRVKQLKCHICKMNKKKKKKGLILPSGASAGCAYKRCGKSFHYYCAKLDSTIITCRMEVSVRGKTVVLYRVFCCQDHRDKYDEKECEDLTSDSSSSDDNDEQTQANKDEQTQANKRKPSKPRTKPHNKRRAKPNTKPSKVAGKIQADLIIPTQPTFSPKTYSFVAKTPLRRSPASQNGDDEGSFHGDNSSKASSAGAPDPDQESTYACIPLPPEITSIIEPDMNSTESEEHDDTCWVCGRYGSVIKCDTCVRVFHGTCLEPPVSHVSDDEWSCPRCQAGSNHDDGSMASACNSDEGSQSMLTPPSVRNTISKTTGRTQRRNSQLSHKSKTDSLPDLEPDDLEVNPPAQNYHRTSDQNRDQNRSQNNNEVTLEIDRAEIGLQLPVKIEPTSASQSERTHELMMGTAKPITSSQFEESRFSSAFATNESEASSHRMEQNDSFASDSELITNISTVNAKAQNRIKARRIDDSPDTDTASEADPQENTIYENTLATYSEMFPDGDKENEEPSIGARNVMGTISQRRRTSQDSTASASDIFASTENDSPEIQNGSSGHVMAATADPDAVPSSSSSGSGESDRNENRRKRKTKLSLNRKRKLSADTDHEGESRAKTKPSLKEGKDSGVEDDTSLVDRAANQNVSFGRSTNQITPGASGPKYTLAAQVDSELPSELNQFLLRPTNTMNHVLCFVENVTSDPDSIHYIESLAKTFFNVLPEHVHMGHDVCMNEGRGFEPEAMLYMFEDISQSIRKELSSLEQILFGEAGLATAYYRTFLESKRKLISGATESDRFSTLSQVLRQVRVDLVHVKELTKADVGYLHFVKSVSCHVMFLCLNDVSDPRGTMRGVIEDRVKHVATFDLASEIDCVGLIELLTPDYGIMGSTSAAGGDTSSIQASQANNHCNGKACEVQQEQNRECDILARWLVANAPRPRLLTRPRESYLFAAADVTAAAANKGANHHHHNHASSVTQRLKNVLLERSDDGQDTQTVVCIGPVNRDVINPGPYVELCLRNLIENQLSARKPLCVLFDVVGLDPASFVRKAKELPAKVMVIVAKVHGGGQNTNAKRVSCILLKVEQR